MLLKGVNIKTAISLKEFGQQLPGKPGYSTVRSWALQGRINKWTKKRVYLKTIQTANGTATSWEAWEQFLKELNQEP